MEDISRELEKEIAQSKPKPYKKDRVTRVLIVDDFGKIRSGEYLKYFLRFSLVFGVVCFVGAILFYKLYSDVSKDSRLLKDRLIIAEEKVKNLTSEKEVLMARLVILGKIPIVGEKESPKDEVASVEKDRDKKILTIKKQRNAPVVPKVKNISDVKASLTTKKVDPITPALVSSQAKAQIGVQKSILKNDMVSIEKFTVKKDRTSSDLLVRFDIRNTSKKSGDVSGRIFTVLKPDNKPQDQWLVVPSAPLKNGIPSEFRKGQYFSIAHFKPVKFRIKNMSGADFFQMASIYIFNSQGDLIFEKLIKIAEADKTK